MDATLETIRQWLLDSGYELGSFACKDRIHRSPAELYPGWARGHHGLGLPPRVEVRPHHTPVDGDHVIGVTPTEAFRATLAYPTCDHAWRIVETRPYASQDELKAILDTPGWVKPSTGCW